MTTFAEGQQPNRSVSLRSDRRGLFTKRGHPQDLIRRVGLCVFFGLTGACRVDDEPLWAGKFVEIYAPDSDEDLCTGSLTHIDRYIERAFEFLGEPTPIGFSVPVYLMETAPCFQGGHTACYSDGAIYMRSLADADSRAIGVLRHEVTHAVIEHIWGVSVPFFNEGIAEAMARSIPPEAEFLDNPGPVGSLLDVSQNELSYTHAARFSHYLIDNYGVSPFKKVFSAASGMSSSELRTLISVVYGRPFEAIEAQYIAESKNCSFQLYLCDLDNAEKVDVRWSLSSAIVCEEGDFYGAVSMAGDSVYALQKNLLFSHNGRYDVRSNSGFTLVRCGTCSEQSVYYFPPGTDAEVTLDAGLYSVEFEFSRLLEEEVRISLLIKEVEEISP